jgi:hypothetical protein
VRFAVAWPRHVERVLSGDRSLAEDKRKRACPPGEASLALVDQAHLAFVRRSALARSGAPDEASPAQRPGALGVCQAICACPIRRNRRGLACSETRRHLALVRRSALARLGAPGEASLAQRPGALGVCQAICACPIRRILDFALALSNFCCISYQLIFDLTASNQEMLRMGKTRSIASMSPFVYRALSKDPSTVSSPLGFTSNLSLHQTAFTSAVETQFLS